MTSLVIFLSWMFKLAVVGWYPAAATAGGHLEEISNEGRSYCHFANFVRCEGRKHFVGSEEGSEGLVAAIRHASAGDTIVLTEGTYDIVETVVDKNLAIRGEGDVVLTSSRPVKKGLLVTKRGISLLIDGVTLQGASSRDHNGAGIRHQGADLVVLNSVFRDNEDGILATADGSGNLTIRNTAFLRNGFGDGLSHGIYVQGTHKLEVVESYFVGTKVGHHIKSMAIETVIKNSTFEDHQGKTSYSIEVASGGDLTIAGCQFSRDLDAGNAAIVFYSTNRGGVPGSVEITGNKVENAKPLAVFLRNHTRSIAILKDNHFQNKGVGTLRASTGPAQVDGKTP